MNETPMDDKHYLTGLRVIELADELGEYCGKLLAGLGADVVKVEPPGGERTREYGPYYHDEPDPNRSLYFWHYNLGKRGIEVDLDAREGRSDFRRLARSADVIIDARPRGYLDDRGIGFEELRRQNPGLMYVRISPFGDNGPWADYQASDLIHLALGGVMMNCGYDPDPFGFYETPPIAPQMWQAYHVTGEVAAMSLLGALHHRNKTGEGQLITASVHTAVSMNTETDSPDWVYLRQVHRRLTCRHSRVALSAPAISPTKDGRYLLPYRTYLPGGPGHFDGARKVLNAYGVHADLDDPKYQDVAVQTSPETREHIDRLIDQLISRLLFEADLWRKGQEAGQPWAPVRRPEENAVDPHWLARGSFIDLPHPELGESFRYVGARWYSKQAEWRHGPRAPMVGEHELRDVLSQWEAAAPVPVRGLNDRAALPAVTGPEGKPFALSDIRVIDLSWMLASAGAGRFLTALGAEVIKVEHDSRVDSMRFGAGMVREGGRAEREAATAPLETPVTDDLNRSGTFMEINAGKLGLSLNLKSEEGKRILEALIRDADMVIEGFSPGTMDRMGFGYERLREINPRIIYVQQSGFGQYGTLGQARAFGPTAQAFSGISDMSGLPEPYPPAGIGYSYLDWFGAYNMATAMYAALARRDRTGEGGYIDASQGETGIYLLGTSVLDHSVNGRRWSRYGNRSPYKPAAPHGAYRTVGDDRWIAIAVFTQAQWEALVEVLGSPAWAEDARFATLQARLAHQDELDRLLGDATSGWEPFLLQEALQARGVPAGVCQTAEDRWEQDPQLRHAKWTVELPQREIGTWPVKRHPVELHGTPAHVGGRVDRSGPNYGEDTDYVLRELVGLDETRIAELRRDRVV